MYGRFYYAVFEVFDGITVYTVHVISRDVRLRSRAWLTHGVTTYCARIPTVSEYHIK